MQLIAAIVLFWVCVAGLMQAFQLSIVLGSVLIGVLAVGALSWVRGW